MDTLIPTRVTGFDLADSIMKGIKVGKALWGTDDDEEKERMTATQIANLLMQRERLDQDARQHSERLAFDRQRFESGLNAPRVGLTMEGVRSKMVRGETLSPGEQKIYDDAQRMSIFDRMLLGGDAGPELSPHRAVVPNPLSTTPPRTSGGMSPSGRAVQFLKSNAHDPNVRRQFEEHYGQPADAFLR